MQLGADHAHRRQPTFCKPICENFSSLPADWIIAAAGRWTVSVPAMHAPSTRPMAAAESRTAAANPRLSRAMNVRYRIAPATARMSVAEVRDAYPWGRG